MVLLGFHPQPRALAVALAQHAAAAKSHCQKLPHRVSLPRVDWQQLFGVLSRNSDALHEE
jgi:hypothetical protein